jgi:hypothetical protein
VLVRFVKTRLNWNQGILIGTKNYVNSNKPGLARKDVKVSNQVNLSHFGKSKVAPK